MKSPTSVATPKTLLFSVFLAATAVQQTTAQVSSDLTLAAVQPYTAEFEYFVDDGAGGMEKAGSWTDVVSVEDGLLSRTVKRFTNEGVVDLLRTVIVERDTIAPVRIQQRFGPELVNVFQLDFSGQSLTQILISDASSPARVATAKLTEPVLETGLQAVFVLSLPMEEDSEIEVKTYGVGVDPKVRTQTFHIIGLEQVEVLGQKLEAWRVEDRASQWTYWVRQSKPYMLKVVHPVPGGKMATSLVTRFDQE